MNRPVLIGISAIVAGIVLAGCAATSPSTSAEEESAGEVVAHGADQQWGLDTGRGDAEYSLGDVAADAAGGLDDPTGGG